MHLSGARWVRDSKGRLKWARGEMGEGRKVLYSRNRSTARRWVVERTGAGPRKEFDATIASAETWLYIASVQFIAQKLARH
ncbi:MAG: hypothetical protein IMF08_14275 [Proteobacteria bacterium]|nr:hypothetical protein [Pseudomonadota bacterium]